MSGYESWSETFFGSAKRSPPPPSPPPHLQAARAVDLTLGEAETSSSLPGAAAPSYRFKIVHEKLKRRILRKIFL